MIIYFEYKFKIGNYDEQQRIEKEYQLHLRKQKLERICND